MVPPSGESGKPLSREAILATGLLVFATIVFIADISLKYLYRKRVRVPTERGSGLEPVVSEMSSRS
jgi:hypothetical protein